MPQALKRPPGLTNAEWKMEQAEFSLASSIVGILTTTYPGFAWSANVQSLQGVILISEVTLMDSIVPYIVRIPEVDHSERAFRQAMVKAGGEILERYFLPREAIGRFKADEIKSELQTDFRGLAIFDAQGVPNYVGKNAPVVGAK